jgi:hypothetical protein
MKYPWKNVPPWSPLHRKLQQRSDKSLDNPSIDALHIRTDDLVQDSVGGSKAADGLSALRVNVGALAKQLLNHLVVASRRCRLERVAILSPLRVDVGALVKQRLDNPIVAFRRCRCKYATELFALRISVGTLAESQLDDFGRVTVISTLGVNVGAFTEE